MRKIWVKRSKSFKEAEKFNQEYYSNMSASKRLEIIQILRDAYFKLKTGPCYESRKRLRRVVRIIKQT